MLALGPDKFVYGRVKRRLRNETSLGRAMSFLYTRQNYRGILILLCLGDGDRVRDRVGLYLLDEGLALRFVIFPSLSPGAARMRWVSK